MKSPDLQPLNQCAAAVGIHHQQFRREMRRTWFPAAEEIDGVPHWSISAVFAARQANVKQRKTARLEAPKTDTGPTAPAPAPGPPPSVVPVKLFADDDPDIMALKSGRSSTLDVSRAGLRMAARHLADTLQNGSAGATQFDAMNKTIARLQSAEASAMDLAERQSNLMSRDDVLRIIGDLSSRFVRAFDLLETSIVTEALLWRRQAGVPADEFTRTVRAFVARHSREIRTNEATALIEKMAGE